MRSCSHGADFCYFRRAEAARKRQLDLVRHVLAAEHQNGMFFEGGAHRRIGSFDGSDVRKRGAAYLCAESRTQRDHLDRQGKFSLLFSLMELYGKNFWRTTMRCLHTIRE